jgi:REP element-mobilizing transposase RayT
MPDHLHWLFMLKANDLSAVVARMKQRSASEVNRLTGRCGETLWQHGFHDRAVRAEEGIVAIARYIVANPLRARLVKRIGDYPFWNAVWL